MFYEGNGFMGKKDINKTNLNSKNNNRRKTKLSLSGKIITASAAIIGVTTMSLYPPIMTAAEDMTGSEELLNAGSSSSEDVPAVPDNSEDTASADNNEGQSNSSSESGSDEGQNETPENINESTGDEETSANSGSGSEQSDVPANSNDGSGQEDSAQEQLNVQALPTGESSNDSSALGTSDNNAATLGTTMDAAPSELTITGDAQEVEYDGQFHYVQLTTDSTVISGINVVTATGDDGVTYYVNEAALSTDQYYVKNVSDSGVFEASVSADNVYTPDKTALSGENIKVTVNSGITVKQKKLVLVSSNIAKPYDGQPLTNGSEPLAVEEGFIDGEGATYNFTGSITEVGVVPNNFDVIPNEGTDLGNYDYLQYKTSGTLEVIDKMDFQKYTLTVTGLSGTYKYDGNEHEIAGYIAEGRSDSEFKVSGNGDPSEKISFEIGNMTYTVTGISASAKATDAGEYEVTTTGSPVVTDSTGKDVTSQFGFEFVSGKLTIEKRNITFKSASDSKKYDGEPLTNDEVTISGDGFVSGQGAKFNVTGKQKKVGVSYNYFTYTMNDGTLESNYDVTKIPGKLKVKAAEENSQSSESSDSSDSSSSDSSSSDSSDSSSLATNTETNQDVLGAKRAKDTAAQSGSSTEDEAKVLGARKSQTDDKTDMGRRFLLIVISATMGITLLKKKSETENE